MNGRLIAIVGPSGSGKDTLIRELRKTLKAYFPIRFITRPNYPNDEKYNSVSETQFESLIKNDDLAFYWSANGLYYGIPRNIDYHLLDGKLVIFNCSRAALVEIKKPMPY
tara:strand:+ start:222 stop:551 length:330 start_codon:yes stop_codon:yes gene_type:complete